MATNRYTDLTTSNFSPLSMQEIMMVPQMKRQQHNAMLAQQQQLLSGLAKVDPLDVHYDEAVRLKQELEGSVDKMATELAQQGVNSNSTANMIALNRQFQDTTSPTGRLGKINNAKAVYTKNFNEYVEDATKNKGWSRERALYNWQNNFANKYTGFKGDDIENIGQYGAPIKVNVLDKLKDVKGLLGEQVVKEMNASGYGLSPGPNGSVIMVDSKGRRIETSNRPNLNKALNLLQDQFNTQEWVDSRRFEGVDDASVSRQLINGVESMLDTKVTDNRTQDAQLLGYTAKPKEDDILTPEYVNVEGVNVTSNNDMLDGLKGISKTGTISTTGGGSSVSGVGSPYTTGENGAPIISKTINSPEYTKLANNIKRMNPAFKDIDIKSPEAQKMVSDYLTKYKDITVQNKYGDPNTNRTAFNFASKEIPKDKNAASNLILERAQRGAYDVVDENGEKIEKNDLGKYTFTYNGDMTPKSVIKTKNGKPLFQKPKQNIGARTGVLIDKETGETKTVYISRGADDFKTPQHRAMTFINGVAQIADTQPGIYHRIEDNDLFKTYGMKNVDIKYNIEDDTYDMNYRNRENVPTSTSRIPSDMFQKQILDDYTRANLK